jgi:ribosomal-protein-alanine N-acetyltransferase
VGCLRATLEVRQGNAPAIALYEGLGFKPVALRPHYYLDTQEDALLMWKERLG